MNADELRQRLDEVYTADILYARQTLIEEKLFAGLRLFEYECQIAREAIRMTYPDLGDNLVEQLLREGLDRRRKVEDAGAYIPSEV